jgi:hypothetical protein
MIKIIWYTEQLYSIYYIMSSGHSWTPRRLWTASGAKAAERVRRRRVQDVVSEDQTLASFPPYQEPGSVEPMGTQVDEGEKGQQARLVRT